MQDVSLPEVSVTDNATPEDDIVYFGRLQALPLRLGFLLDSSGSVIQRSHFEEQVATSFAHNLLKPEVDSAFLVEFTTNKPVLQKETADLRRLDAAIAALDPLGRTPLFDAVYESCKRLAENTRNLSRAARVLVVISDGEDNSSRVTLEQTIAMAQKAEIMVFTVSTRGSLPRFRRRSGGESALKRLAEETGGQAFSPDRPQELNGVLAKLEQEMRNRYVLFYRSSGMLDDARYHRIQVSVHRAGKRLRVHARMGYYAGLPSPDQ